MRQIEVNGKIYMYKVGRQNVSIRDGSKHKYVGFDELTGRDWYSIERSNWKRNFHITPKQIRKYIVENW